MNTRPFIGRKRELSLLQELMHRKVASLVVIKGRRRIGKSRLIEEFAKDKKIVTIAGLPSTDGMTSQHQKDNFATTLAKTFHIPTPYSTDWKDLFWHLSHHTAKGRVVILLDEISWMGAKDPTFLGKLKNAWDLNFKKNPELILVLCGSVSSWIEKNILSSTGFLGRVELTLTLEELHLNECRQFWGPHNKQLSAYEIFKVLAVTGGVPRYLESIVPRKSAEENIKSLCFIKEGYLYNEFEKIFHDLFDKRSDIYKEILITLLQHPNASLEEIFHHLNLKKSGTISNYLEDLVLAGFVRRDYTWSIRNDKTSKLSHFRVNDNYVRFYLKYILPNRSKIERGAFEKRSLSTLPNWDIIMGLQFENLILQNRQNLHKLLNIDPSEIVNDNPYFQRRTTQRKGCQIDYMIQTRFNSLYVCEIKFSRNPVPAHVVDEMKTKIGALQMPKNFSYRPVLIHVNGVEDELISREYFAEIIDFGDLLQG